MQHDQTLLLADFNLLFDDLVNDIEEIYAAG